MSRRKDVPDICGTICALSEKLETLWQRTYDAVKTVNNVQPDGNNNLTVQAGTGIVINPITNGLEIECNIDPQGIETVNGVAADANENVDLVAGTGIAITPDPYNNEVEIACNIDVSGKVDKITTGSTWKAYTHNGATQGDMEISTVDVANSIPRRQADGTLVATTPASTDNGTRVATTAWVKSLTSAMAAALGDVSPTGDTLLRRDQYGKAYGEDPANGATDKTLVTANWISQTGNSAPNNVVHRTGAETVSGIKTFENGAAAYPQDWHATSKSGMASNEYCIFAKIAGTYSGRYHIFDFIQSSNTATVYGRLVIRSNPNGVNPLWAFRKANGGNNPLSSTAIRVLSDGTNIYLAWRKESTYGALSAREVLDISYGVVQPRSATNITWYDTASMIVTNDISGYTDITILE